MYAGLASDACERRNSAPCTAALSGSPSEDADDSNSGEVPSAETLSLLLATSVSKSELSLVSLSSIRTAAFTRTRASASLSCSRCAVLAGDFMWQSVASRMPAHTNLPNRFTVVPMTRIDVFSIVRASCQIFSASALDLQPVADRALASSMCYCDCNPCKANWPASSRQRRRCHRCMLKQVCLARSPQKKADQLPALTDPVG